MKPSDLAQHIYDTTQQRIELCVRKGQDYADEDCLANFKRMNTLCKTLDVDTQRSPTDCALFLVLLKLDRWQNLRSKGNDPKNESVFDTIQDLHNYIDLAYSCEVDKI